MSLWKGGGGMVKMVPGGLPTIPARWHVQARVEHLMAVMIVIFIRGVETAEPHRSTSDSSCSVGSPNCALLLPPAVAGSYP